MATHNRSADTTAAVDQFMLSLAHPLKDAIAAMRASLLACDPVIAEGIKWNAPSFRTSEYFATTNLRQKQGIGLILHLGAKVRATAATGIDIDDPDNMLAWLAKDRAALVFASLADFRAREPAFQALVRSWIRQV
jgi:hypothetical protein